VSIKDNAVLAPMTSLICTDRMSGFMGPDKPSSFYNYFVESYIPRGQDFIPGAGAQVRLSRDMQMVVIRKTPRVTHTACWSSSSLVWCTLIRVTSTLLDMSDRLSLLSSLSMF
jgi:hypothetical protein